MSWSSIRGHARVVRSFQAAWRSHRLGQGYLFVGPSGVGKRALAKELAKAVLCDNSKSELEACNRCQSCILANAGTHPDILLAAKPEEKTELVIEVVRTLCDQLSLKAARGSRKVAIVDNAEDMNDDSANCFLKTLEEPPAGSLLILIGGLTPDRQLRTIISRCQVIQFAALTEADVKWILKEHPSEYPIDDLSISLATGSAGLAIEFAEPKFRELREKLTNELLRTNADLFAWAEQWLTSMTDFSLVGAGQRRVSQQLIHCFVELIRRAWRTRLGDEDLNPATFPLTRQLVQRFSVNQLSDLLVRMQKTDEQIDRSVQMNYAIEALANDVMTI